MFLFMDVSKHSCDTANIFRRPSSGNLPDRSDWKQHALKYKSKKNYNLEVVYCSELFRSSRLNADIIEKLYNK